MLTRNSWPFEGSGAKKRAKVSKKARQTGNYFVEAAENSRAYCAELSCKRQLLKGELRVGEYYEDHDGGDRFRWYHADCLWRAFDLKPSLTRVTSTKQLLAFNQLDEAMQAQLNALIGAAPAAEAPPVAVQGAPAPPAAPLAVPYEYLKDLVLKFDGTKRSLTVTGDTFKVKDLLQSRGARWNAKSKAWVFSAANLGHAHELFGLAAFSDAGPFTLNRDGTTKKKRKRDDEDEKQDWKEKPKKKSRKDD